MKTKKNLVKSMLMSILTAGTFGMGFTACSDDLNEFDTAATETAVAGSDLMNLEQYGYTVPVQIQCQGPWKVEFRFDRGSRHFCYADVEEGVGPQTIKLCVTDNWTDQRNAGEMFITDLTNQQNTKVLRLGQKCNLDNQRLTRAADDNTNADIQEGDILLAVGYGYNVMKNPRDAVASNPILKIHQLRRTPGGIDATFQAHTYTGTSFQQLVENYKASASVSGSYLGFKAEASTAFGRSATSETNKAFAYSIVNAEVTSIKLEGVNKTNRKKLLTEDASIALNGTPDEDGDVAYPSTDEGFRDLIEDFGTHLLLKATLGGHLTYATTIDKSLASTETELKAAASASYKCTFVKADGSVSADMKKKYESSSQDISTTLGAMGGDFDALMKLQGSGGKDTDENVTNWLKSMKDDKNKKVMAIPDREGSDLIPLWELVNDATRKAALKNYMETRMLQDFATTNLEATTSVMTKIGIEAFSNEGTQVKEVLKGGEAVAQICHEYVPSINQQERVTVIYPVADGKARYDMGYYAGDATHRPGKVALNENGEPIYSEYKNMPIGAVSTVYLCDLNFYTEKNDKGYIDASDVVGSTVKPLYLKDQISDVKSTNPHDYPVVKLFNHVWIQEDYEKRMNNGFAYANPWLYSYDNINNMQVAGWQVPDVKAYEEMLAILSKYSSNCQPAIALGEGGVTGFNCKYRTTAWAECGGKKLYKNDQESAALGANYTVSIPLSEPTMRYGCTNGGYAQIKQTGEMLTNTVPYKDWYITVRLVATNLSH